MDTLKKGAICSTYTLIHFKCMYVALIQSKWTPSSCGNSCIVCLFRELHCVTCSTCTSSQMLELFLWSVWTFSKGIDICSQERYWRQTVQNYSNQSVWCSLNFRLWSTKWTQLEYLFSLNEYVFEYVFVKFPVALSHLLWNLLQYSPLDIHI